HMAKEKSMFTSLQLNHDAQEIVFGDSGKGEVVGVGKIPILNDQSISNVLLVNEGVQILRREDSSIAFTGRLKGKLYLVDFTTTRVTPETCLMAKSSMSWLWHRRLAHVGMRNFSKLQKGEHILGLSNVIGTKWVFR